MPAGKLTALKVKSLTAPGRYGDGAGLWLQVRDAERRSWLFRYMVAGKARQMGLGPLADVTLAEARALAAGCRKQILDGVDPINQRDNDRAAKAAVTKKLTFRDVADKYLAAHEGSWKHPKHRAQWRSSLERFVYPVIGDLPVSQVSTSEVMQILEPLWSIKPETASRVRSRIETLLDYARAREWRVGDNPARWRGHVSNMLPARNRARSTKHHPALPWKDMVPFLAALRREPGVAALALEFAILTAARTGEVIGAIWSEIDVSAAAWTIPAARMKGGREHRVPLSDDAVAVLGKVAELRGIGNGGDNVFPGTRLGRGLSNMAMSMLLRRMKRPDLTVHGFRSSFRDWAAEATSFAREVAEAALAHAVENKVEAAYRRGDLFDKRRQMMDAWAAFCSAPCAETASATSQAAE